MVGRAPLKQQETATTSVPARAEKQASVQHSTSAMVRSCACSGRMCQEPMVLLDEAQAKEVLFRQACLSLSGQISSWLGQISSPSLALAFAMRRC
jgi:hypothetical protein